VDGSTLEELKQVRATFTPQLPLDIPVPKCAVHPSHRHTHALFLLRVVLLPRSAIRYGWRCARIFEHRW
jgi:hypothetical protein